MSPGFSRRAPATGRLLVSRRRSAWRRYASSGSTMPARPSRCPRTSRLSTAGLRSYASTSTTGLRISSTTATCGCCALPRTGVSRISRNGRTGRARTTPPHNDAGGRLLHRSAGACPAGPRHRAGHISGREDPSADDVVLQLPSVALQLPDPAGDDVADGDDADESTVVDHRHVPDPALGHRGGDAVDGVLGAAADHRGGHDLLDGRVEEFRAAFGNLAYHVPLGDDADYLLLGGDHECAHVVFGEGPDQRGDGFCRSDRHDVGPTMAGFVPQDVRDVHGWHLSAGFILKACRSLARCATGRADTRAPPAAPTPAPTPPRHRPPAPRRPATEGPAGHRG